MGDSSALEGARRHWVRSERGRSVEGYKKPPRASVTSSDWSRRVEEEPELAGPVLLNLLSMIPPPPPWVGLGPGACSVINQPGSPP